MQESDGTDGSREQGADGRRRHRDWMGGGSRRKKKTCRRHRE